MLIGSVGKCHLFLSTEWNNTCLCSSTVGQGASGLVCPLQICSAFKLFTITMINVLRKCDAECLIWKREVSWTCSNIFRHRSEKTLLVRKREKKLAIPNVSQHIRIRIKNAYQIILWGPKTPIDYFWWLCDVKCSAMNLNIFQAKRFTFLGPPKQSIHVSQIHKNLWNHVFHVLICAMFDRVAWS